MKRICILYAVLNNVLLGVCSFSAPPPSHYDTSHVTSKKKLRMPSSILMVHANQDDEGYNRRRELLSRTAASLLVGGLPLASSPEQSLAVANSNDTVNDNNDGEEGMVSQSKLASLLKRIPTFAIVDKRGVPYFVVGEDAKLTSYFFTSHGEAKRILDVAIKSSDKAIKVTKNEIRAKNNGKLRKEDEEEIGINPWKSARITSVPLDLAVSLASKGKLAGAYFKVAPSELDIEDALATDGSDDLPEGKVPLFYIEDMTIISETGGGDSDGKVSPLYFQKDQLISEWKRQQKKKNGNNKMNNDEPPNVKVTELFATITEMIRPGGKDEELKTLQFVPPIDSIAKAEKCKKGDPFRLGERLVVL